MREPFARLVAVGPLPTDAELDEAMARRFSEALDGLKEPPTAEEAVALAEFFPPDSSTSFGLAWALLHTIESSPGWPVAGALDDRNWWVTFLRERCSRSA